jgi:putative colanic acid biosynthesis acetyltransferase WcaF
MQRTDLGSFNPLFRFDRGRPLYVFVAWYVVKRLFFLSSVPWPSALKFILLRFFGARVGSGSVIKPRVNIWFPWKLEIGSHVWIGEEVVLLNFESIKIGSNSCISQQAFLCAGGHDFRDAAFSYRNAPIVLGEGVWLQARTFVCPGVSIGSESVVVACSMVKDNLPSNSICQGNPAFPLRARWKE